MTLRRAGALRPYVCAQCAGRQVQRRGYVPTAGLNHSDESRLPRVASPSFWTSMIPRFLRRPTDAEQAAERARRSGEGAGERRTGLIFLFLGILVGSNAINIIALRREMLNFTRHTDAKLELLREVVQRVKNGEDVDVKKALGTGDPEQEKEWEQVVQELEEANMLEEGRKKREAKRAEREELRRTQKEAAQEQTRPSPSEPAAEGAANTSRSKFLM